MLLKRSGQARTASRIGATLGKLGRAPTTSMSLRIIRVFFVSGAPTNCLQRDRRMTCEPTVYEWMETRRRFISDGKIVSLTLLIAFQNDPKIERLVSRIREKARTEYGQAVGGFDTILVGYNTLYIRMLQRFEGATK